MKVVENTAATLAALCIAGVGSQASASTVTVTEDFQADSLQDYAIALDSTTPQFFYSSSKIGPLSPVYAASFGTQNTGELGGYSNVIDPNASYSPNSSGKTVSVLGFNTLPSPYIQLSFANSNGVTEYGVANFDSSGDLTTITYQVSAVPEPSSWAMLIAGFGFMGVVAHRRRRRVARLVA